LKVVTEEANKEERPPAKT